MDGSSIASAFASLSASAKIARGIAGLAIDAKIMAEIAALQKSIFDANTHALAAQSEYRSALTRISELETEITNLKTNTGRLENYHLSEVASGVLVYTMKPEAHSGEPPHWLCPNCYSSSHWSVLQKEIGLHPGQADYCCQKCRNQVSVPEGISPSNPATKRGGGMVISLG